MRQNKRPIAKAKVKQRVFQGLLPRSCHKATQAIWSRRRLADGVLFDIQVLCFVALPSRSVGDVILPFCLCSAKLWHGQATSSTSRKCPQVNQKRSKGEANAPSNLNSRSRSYAATFKQWKVRMGSFSTLSKREWQRSAMNLHRKLQN